ncbi:MAG TPA: ATP12 family protein [Allosphingosinicella sp.]|uniref:ATP12 family chaperone protein n=1 Tax=Allosphingosinicella sp. TaxID=2823234 RepID=UPI002F28C204
MKRFYREATAARTESGWEIRLDDRPVKTPARRPLRLPTAALAEAVADEWRAQGDKVDPRSMPLTGLANAAIDRIAPDPQAFARGLASYGESDLLCYRADGPEPLVRRQGGAWDPLLAWARNRFDIDFEVTTGVIHCPQPERTVEQLARAVSARDPFRLAALSPIVTISGSLIIALALDEQAVDLDTAWLAATVDEAWQAEQWGEDAEATVRMEARRWEFEDAHRFRLTLG